MNGLLGLSRLDFDVGGGSPEPAPTIADILGSKLRLHLDMWNRPDLTTEASGFISQIVDAQAGAVFSQAIGSAMPASTNSGRKIPKGDGVDDTLETTTMGWCPTTGSDFCVFGVARNDRTAAEDTTVGCVFSFGNAVPAGIELRRVRATGPDRVLLAGSIGDGVAGNVIGAAYATENFMGAVTFRLEVSSSTSTVNLYVDDVLTGTLAITPTLTLSRARILASAVVTANRFGASNVASIVVSDMPTPEEIAAVEAVHSIIASQLAAA